jgi:molybdopterin converting factor subunit 1
VLYFASAKDAAGLTSEYISIPDTSDIISITELFESLETKHPKLKQKKILSSVAVAVNLEYVDLSDGKVKAGDEVAIIPPVSGG